MTTPAFARGVPAWASKDIAKLEAGEHAALTEDADPGPCRCAQLEANEHAALMQANRDKAASERMDAAETGKLIVEHAALLRAARERAARQAEPVQSDACLEDQS